MPSTPRMQEIERKASTPGEGLSRDEVTEWHMLNLAPQNDLSAAIIQMLAAAKLAMSPDYTAANRYLDAPGWKARPHG